MDNVISMNNKQLEVVQMASDELSDTLGKIVAKYGGGIAFAAFMEKATRMMAAESPVIEETFIKQIAYLRARARSDH